MVIRIFAKPFKYHPLSIETLNDVCKNKPPSQGLQYANEAKNKGLIPIPEHLKATSISNDLLY